MTILWNIMHALEQTASYQRQSVEILFNYVSCVCVHLFMKAIDFISTCKYVYFPLESVLNSDQ